MKSLQRLLYHSQHPIPRGILRLKDMREEVSTVFLLTNWEFTGTILNLIGMTPA